MDFFFQQWIFNYAPKEGFSLDFPLNVHQIAHSSDIILL